MLLIKFILFSQKSEFGLVSVTMLELELTTSLQIKKESGSFA